MAAGPTGRGTRAGPAAVRSGRGPAGGGGGSRRGGAVEPLGPFISGMARVSALPPMSGIAVVRAPRSTDGVGFADGWPPAATSSSVVSPSSIWSPGRSAVASRTRMPLTRVPFEEPRSSITSSPDAVREIRAWRRDSSGSSPRRPGWGASRPISSPPSRPMRLPAAGPARTWRLVSVRG